jgi:hypothetical protein
MIATAKLMMVSIVVAKTVTSVLATPVLPAPEAKVLVRMVPRFVPMDNGDHVREKPFLARKRATTRTTIAMETSTILCRVHVRDHAEPVHRLVRLVNGGLVLLLLQHPKCATEKTTTAMVSLMRDVPVDKDKRDHVVRRQVPVSKGPRPVLQASGERVQVLLAPHLKPAMAKTMTATGKSMMVLLVEPTVPSPICRGLVQKGNSLVSMRNSLVSKLSNPLPKCVTTSTMTVMETSTMVSIVPVKTEKNVHVTWGLQGLLARAFAKVVHKCARVDSGRRARDRFCPHLKYVTARTITAMAT